MKGIHTYNLTLEWTGNRGSGTVDYRAYERSHLIQIEHKLDIAASSDSSFRGDNTKHNPEELLLASLSSCHMLWYLHLCSEAGIIVVEYVDNAKGTMVEDINGGGRFTEVVLNPIVSVTQASMIDQANALHEKANKMCFIANSVNFPVMHRPVCVVSEV